MEYMYFNNAGAGIMSEITAKTVIDHMNLEMSVGAYKAANSKTDDINKFYSLAASLLNANSKEEIAFIDSASRGWNLVMYGLHLTENDTIVTLSSEYGTNLRANCDEAVFPGLGFCTADQRLILRVVVAYFECQQFRRAEAQITHGIDIICVGNDINGSAYPF